MDPLLISRLLVIFHFLFLAFVVLGGFLVVWRPRWAWLHVPCAAWGAAIIGFGWVCPLTPLENRFRAEAGVSVYDGGFIEQYLLMAVYPPGMTRGVQLLLAMLLGLLLALQYGLAWWRHGGRGGHNAG